MEGPPSVCSNTAATGVASDLQQWQPKPPKRRRLAWCPRRPEAAYIDAVSEAPLPRELKTVLVCVATHSDRNGTGAFMFARTLGRWCGLRYGKFATYWPRGVAVGSLDVEYDGPTGGLAGPSFGTDQPARGAVHCTP